MNRYSTVADCCSETEIKHSRFIAIVKRVRSEEELFSELAAIRKKYSDATHVCYAAVFDKTGNAARFSDDGEPGGTAGQPILEVIKKAALSETLVAVVRYFGGIKLGAGGLVRAYSSSAAECVKNAVKIDCVPVDVYSLTLDFSDAKRFEAAARRKGIKILSTEYSSAVTFNLGVNEGENPEADIAEILAAKPKLERIETKYIEQLSN